MEQNNGSEQILKDTIQENVSKTKAESNPISERQYTHTHTHHGERVNTEMDPDKVIQLHPRTQYRFSLVVYA